MIKLRKTKDGIVIPVYVTAGAAQARIIGEYNGALKLAVCAPPEKGKANKAVIALLGRNLGLKKHDIMLKSGAASRRKLFLVHNPATSIEYLRTQFHKFIVVLD